MAAAAVPRAARGALQVVGLDGRSAGARPLPVTGSYRAYSQELGVHVWNVEAPSGLADCGSWRVVVHRALCVGNDRESGGLVAGPPKDLTHGYTITPPTQRAGQCARSHSWTAVCRDL